MFVDDQDLTPGVLVERRGLKTVQLPKIKEIKITHISVVLPSSSVSAGKHAHWCEEK